MPSNTTTSVQSNETFSTSTVDIATGVLNANPWNCGVGMNYAEMTTTVTGSPTSFTILLEGTYDGTNWATIATASNVAGETQYATGAIPFLALRARCTAVVGGTSPTVNVYVTVSQTPFTVTAGGTSNASNISITAPVDGNGNVKVSQQGAITNAQVANRYASVSNTATSAAAPAAGTAIASIATFDFYYQVDVYVGFAGTAETATADNFVLKAGAATLYTLPASNAVNQLIKHTFFVNPGGSVNLTVNVGGTNGSAGSLYKAAIIATRLV